MTQREQSASGPPGGVRPNDAGAIREMVAAAEQSQNDIDRFIPLHTPDTVIVNIAGRRVLGRQSVQQAMKHALAIFGGCPGAC